MAAAEPPVITVQPKNQSVAAGTSHTFSVTVTGDAPLRYQWSVASSALTGETNSTLQLTNIQSANGGSYFVVVSNNVGAITSAVAILVVRATNDPVYATPDGGWAYRYDGIGAASTVNAALDGTWTRPTTTSDSWSGDGRGAGNGLPGGVSTTNGVLTVEDAVTSGTSSTDNRRYYFMHNLAQEAGITNANTILNDGVTLTFRARITPPPPGDPLTELANAPNGYVNFNGGKGMFGIRQSGDSGMIISFSLNRALEDLNTTSSLNLGQNGLHMNSLNGDVRSPSVDPGSGAINLLPIESSEFHEFWITVQENGSSPGTHRVSVYVDGAQSPTVFNVTAGTGSESPSAITNYLAMGLPSTAQRGAYDIDFYGYKSGVVLPTGYNDPVTISAQPVNQAVAAGQNATFSVTVAGTPPFGYQWYRDGSAVANATNSTYTTEPVDGEDDGAAFVVVVSNFCNVVTSSPPAILQLLVPPTITTQPQSLTVTNGDPASFTVVANSAATLYYQWRFNGSNLADQTNSTLVFSSVSPIHAGGYDVIVSNIVGSVTSLVATLEVRVFDFGDAPDPYATLLANNGARHLIVSGVRLGAAIDDEVNGQTNGLATADDLAGTDDEDGVVFISPLQAGNVAIVEVVASTNGFLNGWMDFNGNGAWTEAGEQIFTNRALLPGTNLLNFVVPGAASATNSFGRFRFSTSTNLSFNGPAADGEVEDYAVVITPVADLGVTIVDSGDPMPVNSNIVYTITVTNAGPSTAADVLVDDILPANVTVVSFSSSQGSCAPIGNTIRCTLGSLGPSGTATVSVTIASSNTGTLTNIAVASAAPFDPVPANNSVTELTTVEAPPSISAHPVSLVVTQGNPASFSVTTAGSAPLAYQWLLSGNPLGGETNATLTIAAAQPAHEGAYTVRITNRVGAVLSAAATLTVLVPPTITQQPASRTNMAGSQATFSVTATGSQPLAYQWRFNSAPLSGQTSATLTLNNVQKSQTGDYTVTISNSAGVITSAVARLTVLELDFGDAPAPYPTLLADNGARHLLLAGFRLGASADFEPNGLPNPTATGDDTNSLADEDGVTFSSPLLVGQTATVAVVSSTGGVLNAWIDWAANGNWSNAGDQVYTNRLLTAGTNLLSMSIPTTAAGTNTFARFRFSSVSNLTFVGEAPDGEVEDYRISILPLADLSVAVTDSPDPVAVGSNLVYMVAVTNSGPSAATAVILSNNVSGNITVVSAIPSQGSCSNVSGVVTCALGTLAAGSTATLELTVRPAQAQTVTNRVNVVSAETDLSSTNNSAIATTLAQVYPVITGQPQSQTVTNGSTVMLTVTATGTALQYQWLKQGTNLAGEVNSSLTISNVQPGHAGTYTVRVNNSVGAVLSDPAVLTVWVPPQITIQPQSQTVRQGDPFSLSVTATGTQPLAYQWLLNGAEVPGANSSILSIASAQPEHEGTYRVLVSNSAGSEQSQPATITLVTPPSISQQPQSRTNTARSTATFSVVAAGTAPLSYRWYFNQTTPLPNATNTTLTLTNVQRSQDGDYSVVVTNAGGAVTSLVARLVVLETDFGDAPPIGYPTLLAFNGARHQVVTGIHLGSRVDFEADGQPSSDATGDDTETSDDEDGITFASPLRIGQPATVQVVASTNGFLDAWIDFDRNGAWADVSDQIFFSQPVSPGTNLLSYQVAATALATNTFARFRFSTNGGLLSDGAASSGEVEDYQVTVLPVVNLSAVVISVPEPVPVFSNLTYTITVSNSGSSACSAARLLDPLPTNAEFVSVNSSRGGCTNDAGTIDCAFGTLEQGQTAIVSLVVRPVRAGLYTNEISVTAPEFDPDLANNTVEIISTAIGTPAPFINNDNLVIADPGVANRYPSTMTISGLTSMVYNVTVTLSNLSHNWPADLDVLLVGPGGQSVLLMSDAAAGERADNVTIKFHDDSPIAIPEAGRLIEATFQPTNYGETNDVFPAPAPAGPYGSQLAVFTGTNPNGTWSLYVLDDEVQDSGNIAGGWHLQITTLHPISDVGVTARAQPEPVIVESNLTYTVTVTNRGPAATTVFLTNPLPPNVTFISAIASQGSCTNNGGLITCALGNLASNAGATITMVIRPDRGGSLTNVFGVAGSEVDLVTSNNTTSVVSSVRAVSDLVLALTEAPEPAGFGHELTYFLRVTNLGPNRATAVVATDALPPGILFTAVTASQGSCSNESGTVICNFGDLTVGAVATATITATVNVMGPFTNTSSVTLDEIDMNPANNVASEVTTGVALFGPLAGLGLAIPTQGAATPYPSTITVSGLTGEVYEVSVTLSNISHTFPDDLDILLVRPEGQTVLLVSDAGDGNIISNVTITLNDSFTASLPDSGAIVAGQFRPTQYETGSDMFPPSAPPGPYGTNLAVFQRTDPNGIWSLYILDDRAANSGTIAGWSLTIATLAPIADVAVAAAALPETVGVGSNLVYTYTVTNRGPAPAIGVTLSNRIPAAVSFVSVVSTQGACSNNLGTVECEIGGLAVGSIAQVTVTVVPNAAGTVSNHVAVAGTIRDHRPTNNAAVIQTAVQNPPVVIQQPQSVTVTNGTAATFAVSFAGTAPFSFQWRHNGIDLPGQTNSTLVVSNVQLAQAGNYRVRVANQVGAVLSDAAALTVLVRPTISTITNQTTDEDIATAAIGFTVEDHETSAAALVVTASSSDPVLVPESQITLSGTGTNRSVQIQPATNRFGTASIILTVRDSDGISATTSFELLVRSGNDLPTISMVQDQTTDEDTPKLVSFSVDDVETTAGALVVTVTSSNNAIVPTNLMVFGGGDNSRTLQFQSAPDQFGVTSIGLTVHDTDGGTASTSFAVTIVPVNDPPTLDSPAAVVVDEDTPTEIALTGITAGPSNEIQTLSVTARSSNPALVPDPVVIYTSANTTGKLALTFVANANGAADIMVMVEEDGASNNIITRSFPVTVRPVNDLPQISTVSHIVIEEDSTATGITLLVSDIETPPQDLIVTGTSSNTVLLANSNIVVTGASSNRTATLIPSPNEFGTSLVTLTVADGNGGVSSNAFLFTVLPVNDPPTFDIPAALTVSEDSGLLMVAVSGISPGFSNEAQTVTITAASTDLDIITNLTVNYSSPDAVGTLIFGTISNISGVASITVTADDGAGSNNITVQTFTVTIEPVNDLPLIVPPGNQTIVEDSATAALPFAIGDVESPAATLTVTAFSSDPALVPDANIVLTGGDSNRFVTVTPLPNAYGVVSINLRVTDPDSGVSVASFSLDVTGVNDPPAISGIPTQVTNEDTPVIVPFVLTDPDDPLETLQLSATSGDAELLPPASFVFSESGTNRTVTITPASNDFGATIVTITVRDRSNAVATTSFYLAVNAVNDAPAISDISNQTTDENITTALIAFSVSDIETVASSLQVSAVSSDSVIVPPANILFGGGGSNRTVRVRPATNQTGTVSIRITVRDAQGASSSDSFDLTITPIDAAPALAVIPDQMMAEDRVLSVPIAVSDSDTSLDNLILSATSSNESLVPNAGLSFSGTGADRILTITPAPNQSGVLAITVAVADAANTNSHTFELTIVPVNDPPSLDSLSDITLPEDFRTRTVALSGITAGAGDESQSLILSVTSDPAGILANVMVNHDGSSSTGLVSFSSVSNVAGSVSITVSVNDGGSSNNVFSRTFDVTVEAVDDAPEILPITAQVLAEDTSLALVVEVRDADTQIQNLVLSAVSSNEVLAPNANFQFHGSGQSRLLIVSPATDQFGNSDIRLSVSDGTSAASQTFRLDVTPVNDAPTLDPIADIAVTRGSGQRTIDLLGITAGAANENQTLSIAATSSNPALIPDPAIIYTNPATSGLLRFTPAASGIGTALITVTVDDGGVSNNITRRFFTIYVRDSDNQSPTILSIADQTTPQNTPVQVSFQIDDPETAPDSLTLAANSQPSNLVSQIVFGGAGTNRTVQITPATDQSGTTLITISVRDPEGAEATESFLLTVTAPAPSLSLSAISDQTTPEDTPVAVAFTLGHPLPDFSILTATSSNGALVAVSNILFSGSGSNRTAALVPSLNATGTTLITLSATNGSVGATRTFLLTVTGVNDAPTLNPIDDRAFDSGNQQMVDVPLSGITSGAANETQTLSVTAVSSAPAIVSITSVSYTSPADTGSVRIRKERDATGTAVITITVSDGQATNSRSFSCFVKLAANAAPTISAIPNAIIDEDTSTGLLNFTMGDSTTPASLLTVSATSLNPALLPNSNIVFGGSGSSRTVMVSPLPNQSGTGVVRVTVTDTNFGMAYTNFTVTVRSVNDLPTAGTLSNLTVNEDPGVISIPIAVGDIETPASHLVLSASYQPSNLISRIDFGGSGSARVILITSASNQFGVANVNVSIRDADGGTTVRAFNLGLTSVNDAPTLDRLNDLSVARGSGAQSVPLSGISSGAPNENQVLTVTAVSSDPTAIPHPQITYTSPNSSGTLTFAPTQSASGSATIMVTVSDGGASNSTITRSFSVTIRSSGGGLPAISDISDQSIVEDTTTGPLSFTIGDGETPVNALTVTASSSNPALVVPALAGSASNRTVTLTPLPNMSGTATVTIGVSDSDFGFTSTDFLLTVSPTNDAPTISWSAGFSLSIVEDTETLPLAVTIGDVETPAGNLVLTASSSNPALIPGTNIFLGGSGSNRTVVARPLPNQTGVATLTVRVSDGSANSQIQFDLNVTATNDPPSISSIGDQITDEDVPLGLIPIVIDDLEPGTLILSVTSSNPDLLPPANVNVEQASSLLATPVTNQFGETLVTLTVSDEGASASTSFLLTVRPINDPPTLDALNDTTLNVSAGPQIVSLTGITSGPSNELQTLAVSAVSSNPQLIPNPTVTYASPDTSGTLSFQPVAGVSGTAVITVSVNDGQPTNNLFERAFTVTVNGAPVIGAIGDQTTDEDVAAGPIGFTLADPDTAADLLNVTITSSYPSLVPNANVILSGAGTDRFLTITPTPNRHGFSIIQITASDPQGNSSSTSFAMVVLPVNDPPSISEIPDQSIAVNGTAGPVGFSIYDLETAAAHLWISATSSNPLLVPDANITLQGSGSGRSVTIQPLANQQGTSTITISVTDTNGGITIETLLVTVNGGGTAPTITRQPVDQSVLPGRTATFVVSATGNGPLTYQWRHNGTALTGATSPMLVINNVQSTDIGEYTVEVSNAHATIASGPARLAVLVAATITDFSWSPTTATISFETLVDLEYTVQFTDSLSPPDWTALETIAGTGATVTITDLNPSAATRFYRIRAE